jgi:hypothetical protein
MRTLLRLIPGILLVAVLVAGNAAAAGPPPTPPDSTDHPMNLNLTNQRAAQPSSWYAFPRISMSRLTGTALMRPTRYCRGSS